jgi:GT2 family glycosyltransferase
VSLRFSVVVPTYERPALVARCLDALARQNFPREQFEVIVVDDGAARPLAEILPPVPDGLAPVIMRIANAGAGAARNAGAARARGRYLAFTDDDCRPSPDWLRMLDARLQVAPAHLIGGRTVNGLPSNHWATTSQAIVGMAYAFYNADPAAPRFFASNNIAVPADVFAAVGGFRADGFRVASEDRELCDRWRHAGQRLAYEPRAVVEHAHALGFAGFCRQHFRYGRGAMRYHQARAARRSGRFRDDLPFYLHLPRLLRIATRELAPGAVAHVVPRLLLWQLCNAAGYAYERGRELTRTAAGWKTSARPSLV